MKSDVVRNARERNREKRRSWKKKGARRSFGQQGKLTKGGFGCSSGGDLKQKSNSLNLSGSESGNNPPAKRKGGEK